MFSQSPRRSLRIGSLLYVAPVALVALAIAFREMKGKTGVADGDDDLR